MQGFTPVAEGVWISNNGSRIGVSQRSTALEDDDEEEEDKSE